MDNAFIISVLLVSTTKFTVGQTEASDFSNDLDCAGCSIDGLVNENEISPEGLRKIKLEIIKQQILQKLRLKQPPNVTNPVLPELIVKGRVLQAQNVEEQEHRFSKDDFYGTTQQVVIFPEKTNTYNCYTRDDERPNCCFRFRLTREVTRRSVSSAELWVYAVGESNPTENELDGEETSRNRVFTVIDVAPHPHGEGFLKRVVAIKETGSSPGWIKFELAPAVRTWALRKHMAHALEISCDGCSPGLESPVSVEKDQKPFLVVDTDSWKVGHRRRRSVTCTGDDKHCCKEKFRVDFSDINWHRWIIFPDGYEANFCRGSCVADISSSRYHHTSVLRRYIQKSIPGSKNITLSLCCTPYIMKPLTLIYIDENNNIFKTALPNMIVESCECA